MARFTAIVGEGGAGKTTFLTGLLYMAYQSGRPVISNYRLFGIPHRIMPFSNDGIENPEYLSLVDITNKEYASEIEIVRNSLVGVDELGKGADSMDFFLNTPRRLGTVATQSRKMGMEFAYTVQRESMIARRLRILTDAFFFMSDDDSHIAHCRCKKRADPFICTCGTPYQCAAKYTIVATDGDLRVLWSDKFNGKPFQTMYDTDEIIWG